MRIFSFLALVSIAGLLAGMQLAIAASPGELAFRKLELAPQWPWRAGFLLEFSPDESACKKAYGSRWAQKCAAPLGIPGRTVRGISVTPHARGHWQWESAYTARFIPEDGSALESGRVYKIDTEKMALPANLKLAANKAQTFVLPLSAKYSEARFWLDPSQEARHRIFFALDFNFPVQDHKFNPRLRLPAGAQVGQMEAVFNQERDHVSLSWPVLKLPAVSGPAVLELPEINKIIETENGLVLQGNGLDDAVFSLPLPAADEIFTIRDARILQERTANLDSGYVLEITSSLHASPAEIAEKIFLVELPEYKSPESLVAYDWANTPAISASDLKRGKILKITTSVKGKESTFRFNLPIGSGRHVFVGIDKNLKSASGLSLARPFAKIVRAEPLMAQIGFLQPGNILSGKRDIGIFATDVDEINWQIQLIDNAFLALISASSANSFADPLAESTLKMESLSRSTSGSLQINGALQGQAQHSLLNPARIMSAAFGQDSGLVRINLEGMKAGKRVAEASRLILVTDLGIIAKRSANGNLDCFAYSLATGRPEADIEVNILGANGRPVYSSRSDSRGYAGSASLAGLSRESRPVAVVARKDNNFAWLPLTNKSRALDYSAFETGGIFAPEDITATVFSQRGIYKPGETLHFGALLKKGDFTSLPPELPIYAEILNPAGRSIWNRIVKPGEFGLLDISWQSMPESVSGRYILNLRTARDGAVLGHAQARLEAYQPDTMKMRVENPAAKGWLKLGKEDKSQVFAELRNLYGSPAAGHLVESEIHASPATFRFPEYADFTFSDPAPFSGNRISRKLPDQKSDAQGRISLEYPRELTHASLKATVACEGYELGGGRSTASSISFLASPASRILGFRPVGALTNLDFIPANSDTRVELLAIDWKLAPVAWKDLRFALLERKNVTSLIADGQGGYRYDEVPDEILLKTWTFSLQAGPREISLPVEKPGEYLLRATAENGAVALQIPYNVVGDRLLGPDEPLQASKMRMRVADKPYKGGDVIEVACTLPYDAAGLLAIERDDIQSFEWVDAHAGENVFRIRIPDEFEGKGYVTAAFMRKETSPLVYMKPLAFAAAPFTARADRREMGLDIAVPAKAIPGSTLEVNLSARKPGKAILFAVDEGILQLTGWQAKNPVRSLLLDRALSVETLQAADLLMPAAGRLPGRFAAFGGDMDSSSPFGSRFQNPFRRRGEPPLVFWSGIVNVGSEPSKVKIPLPSWYAGAVRISALGASVEAAGCASASVSVAGPIALFPQMPVFAAPGDEFGGTLVVANTTGRPFDLALACELSEGIEIVKALPGRIQIDAENELALPFSLRAGTEPCIANVKFRIRAPDWEFSRAADLSIRPPSELRTTLQSGLATKEEVLPAPRSVYAHDASSSVYVSGLPLPLAFSLGNYLQFYPYGCTEQLVSRAFTALKLHKWPQIRAKDETGIFLARVVDAIAGRFNGQYVALWPQGEGSILLTAYSADFLLALRESGLGNADYLLENLCDAIRWNCSLNEPTLANARACAYAIWVLAREGRIVTQQLEELQGALTSQGVSGWEEDITSALMAAAKKEMSIEGTPDFSKIRIQPDGWFDEFGQRSLLMMLAQRYFPDSLAGLNKQEYLDFAISAVNRADYSTWSAAQGVSALVALAGDAAPDLLTSQVECADAEEALSAEILANGKLLAVKTGQCEKYLLKSHGDPLYWQIATAGYDRMPVKEALANGIEIKREYLDLDGNVISGAKVGDEILARIIARAEEPLKEDCVISDLLPGCMERKFTAADGRPTGIKNMDAQEDRTLIFADLSSQPLEIVYRCRVIASGNFTIPAVTAQAMYDAQVYGQGKSGIFRVVAD